MKPGVEDLDDRGRAFGSRIRELAEANLQVPEPAPDWLALGAARSYVDAHLCDAIRVGAMCDAANMSQSSLERAFRRHLDTTPKRYVWTRRLDLVRRALMSNSPKRRIAEVAREHGVRHLGRFSVDFREHFGVSPSEVELFAPEK